MNKNKGRYSVAENEDYEPGSDSQVLKNHLSIKTKNEIEEIESEELDRMEIEIMEMFDENHQFTTKDICHIHKLWLGKIYPFAGKYRSVSMSKGGFPFAAPDRIARLMQQLEKDYLAKNTPCQYTDINELANAIGTVHVELIIIHPFREGNGRTARMLADLMVMQAKGMPLDYSPISQTTNENGFKNYIIAIHQGFNGNYESIKKIFTNLISGTSPN